MTKKIIDMDFEELIVATELLADFTDKDDIEDMNRQPYIYIASFCYLQISILNSLTEIEKRLDKLESNTSGGEGND